MSRNYSVNDDVYGKILKSHTNLKPQTEYAEVFEACEGLGIVLWIFSSDKTVQKVLYNYYLTKRYVCLYNWRGTYILVD